jgi:hypothetical protein
MGIQGIWVKLALRREEQNNERGRNGEETRNWTLEASNSE